MTSAAGPEQRPDRPDGEPLVDVLLRSTGLSVFAKDLGGRHLYVNPAGAALVGKTVEEIIGRTDAELYGEEVAEHFLGVVRAALATPGTSVRTEVTIPTPDGPVPHISTLDALVDDAGEVTGVMGILVDVSVRAEAERLLLERTRQLAIAERIARMGDWTWDPVTDVIGVGPELCRLLGSDPDTAWDLRRLAVLVHPEDKGRVIRSLVAARNGAVADETFRARVPGGIGPEDEPDSQRGHGGLRWLRLRTEPISTFGSSGLVIGTVQDVTDAVLAERERSDLEMRLHRTQRLESVGRLAGGIAHDFNNLLAVMRIEVDLARQRSEQTPSAVDHLRSLDTTLDRAAALVRQLLVFSRHDHHEVAPVDVAAVVREMTTMIDRTTGDDVVVVADLRDDLPPAVADPTQLEQVVMNLAVNARDAMPRGGTLSITVRGVAEDGGASDPEVIELVVADDGLGMPEHIAAQVFEPFFTTKGPEEGTGLGLTTVQSLVARWGGTVELSSTEGRGTCVTIRLAATTSEGDDERDVAEFRTTSSDRDATVLVVEDLATLGRLTVTVLQRAGFRAVHAMNAADALAIVDRGLEPDVLVTDVVMPGMSGSELATTLRERDAELAVLYMSGYSAGMLRDRLDDDVELLAKPFSADALIEAVERALRPTE